MNFKEKEPSISPSKHELDAFRMKVITLLNKHDVGFSSMSEQLQMIREVPVVLIDKNSAAERIVMLHQTISPFPGEIIKLKGAFKRHSKNDSYSIPISESFQLNIQCEQTGFPHPLQRNGWSLSPKLLLNHALNEKLKETAVKLYPKGSLNFKAKALLKQKHLCFDTHCEEFLEFHKQLNKAIVNAARIENMNNIDQFFENLKMKKNRYHLLSHLYYQAAYCFDNSIDGRNSQEETQNDNLLKMIEISYQRIMQIHRGLLEKIAEKQFYDFIDELEKPIPSSSQSMYEQMKSMLLSDIKLLEM